MGRLPGPVKSGVSWSGRLGWYVALLAVVGSMAGSGRPPVLFS